MESRTVEFTEYLDLSEVSTHEVTGRDLLQQLDKFFKDNDLMDAKLGIGADYDRVILIDVVHKRDESQEEANLRSQLEAIRRDIAILEDLNRTREYDYGHNFITPEEYREHCAVNGKKLIDAYVQRRLLYELLRDTRESANEEYLQNLRKGV